MSTLSTKNNVPEIHFLTREEQAKLHHVSYQNRYGCLIRTMLYTGIRLGELLALRWEDIDMCSGQLLIRRTMCRVPTGEPNERKAELVAQTPKSPSSVRKIPLLPAVMQDLMGWRELQWKDHMEVGELYQDSGFIATDPQGNCLDPKKLYEQGRLMATAANIGLFGFHMLRTTYAVRAIEQGINPQVLSWIMGYDLPHMFSGQDVSLMGELFAIGQNYEHERAFLIVLKLLENGLFDFHCPDYPEIFSFTSAEISHGLLYMKECIEDEILLSPWVVEPTPISYYEQQPWEIWMQVLL